MNFEIFETEFLINLKNKNNKCFNLIDNNRNLIRAHLDDSGNQKTIDRFVSEINTIVLKTKNNFSFIKKVLSHIAFINVLSRFRNSDILIQACKSGNISAVKWLLEMNINPFVQDENSMTALMYAAKDVSLLFVVKHFILNEDCLNIVDKKGENALFYSLYNSKALAELVKSKININQLNTYNETALIYCCKNELYAPLLILLTNESIDVNYVDDNGKSAAMYLAEKGRYLELKALSKRQCHYDFINMKLESALSLLLKNMYELGDKTNLYSNYIRTLMALIDLKCNLNIPVDDDENTAIMVFIIVKDFNTLNYVLKNGKDIDLSRKNRYGENASSLYIKSDCKNKCRIIVDNPTFDFQYIDDNNKNTMLMLASMNQPLLVKRIINSNMFSINDVNSKNENALILATKSNNLKSVEELIGNDVCINQKDFLGNTALYYAVDLGNTSIIRRLMFKNADINIKNNEGKSALDLANEIGNIEILNILMSSTSGSSYFYQDEFTKISQRVSESRNSNKYSELEEYLYPWISNNYSGYKITETFESTAEKLYKESNKNNKNNNQVVEYRNKSGFELSGFEVYLIFELVTDVACAILELL